MELTKKEKKQLITLICDKQTKLLIKHPDIYGSEEYRDLEALKVKIKNM